MIKALTTATFCCIALIAGGCFQARADLSGADLTGPSSGTTTGKAYKGWCGESRADCQVTFKDERLIVNNGDGIYRSQVKSAQKNYACRYKTIFGITDCSEPWTGSTKFYDKDFLITYRGADGSPRTAVITFRNEDSARDFERDLSIWMQSIMRPVGPSIEIK